MAQQQMHCAGGSREGCEEINLCYLSYHPKRTSLRPPQELHLRKIYTPSWWRALHTWGLLAVGSMRSGLCSICLPSRCTRPSTSLSSPWPTPHAVCSIFAAVPFGNYLAKSAFTSYPCYPCQSPCKITSFWNQRVFCTENQSVRTKALALTAAVRGGCVLRRAPRAKRGRPGWHLPCPLADAAASLSFTVTLEWNW